MTGIFCFLICAFAAIFAMRMKGKKNDDDKHLFI